MAKKYVGSVTVKALMELIKTEFDAVDVSIQEVVDAAVKNSNIITDLAAYTPATGDNKVVAAEVIKELKEAVDALTTGTGAAVTATDVLKTWDGYDADADADKVVAASLVKAIKDQLATLSTTVSTELDGKKGQPNGIASLDDTGKVPASQLPSYVDDVVEGFMTETTEGDTTTRKFYEPDAAGTAASTTEIVGEKGKIYVDLAASRSYRWSGSTFVRVDEIDLVELTPDEVEALWNEVAATYAASEG